MIEEQSDLKLTNASNTLHAELGDQQKDLDKNLEKQKDPKYCGSCYDGKKPPSGCCNTCDDVVKAYKDVGWAFSYENAETIEQCQKEHWVEKMKSQSKEGCRIQGKIEVNKVAGNVHLAPGASFQQNNLHVHDLNPYLKPNLSNFAHQIHSLSFGESVGIQNPLDGVEKKTDDREYELRSIYGVSFRFRLSWNMRLEYETFQYYIKVVSTRFVFMNGTVVHTNQFSATEHERSTKHSTGLPGIFFNYDISPMLVIYTEYQKPLSHFLTDICAIVGGVFTVAGILDSFIYTAERTLKKKMELGKAS
ncbi:Endoplasmic reticulum-Golgi intermediate compartment protein 3 [Borealophlyctis nickersoniae]|nr:Endoplasmic reticulum-Golgi intermediate compartment protein 3 [Borealophlyctis nickersoniae]